VLRCAIYTRQSSVPHHGDTSCEFQFDACLSLVKARAGIGWTWVGTRYDDPGFCGATMDRPGLQQLIQSVERDEVNIVVVEYSTASLAVSIIRSDGTEPRMTCLCYTNKIAESGRSSAPRRSTSCHEAPIIGVTCER
jgi:hypothetical protein